MDTVQRIQTLILLFGMMFGCIYMYGRSQGKKIIKKMEEKEKREKEMGRGKFNR